MTTVIKRLKTELSDQQVLVSEADLRGQRHDYWVVSHLRNFQKREDPSPLCIVRPCSTKDVQVILKVASETRTPVTPYGLGSGVCGGVLASPDVILLDMGAMNQIVEIDEVNLLATFEAGKNGLEAENAVAEKGFTIGHWPQSIGVSSVGGWIATRASGQFSTAYGNIEDIVYSIEAVLPNGEVVTAGKAPRASAGPDLRHLLLGSEGTLAVITKVTLSLRRAAAAQMTSAYYVPQMVHGFEAQRQMIQSGFTPPVVRQYDASEAQRNFPKEAKEGQGLLIMVHEGPKEIVPIEKEAVLKIAVAAGLQEAPLTAVSQWLSHRNSVPTWETFFEQNAVVDTIEVSAPWSLIETVYERVVSSLSEVPGIVNASAHSSHVYRSGINLYFTFGVHLSDPAGLEDAYFECWKRVVEETSEAGGGVAHHHGIGRVRRDYLHLDLGAEGIDLLRTIKQALDPDGILNPGVLIP
jgi:alkyldihydroxyacetonephosphate synthase